MTSPVNSSVPVAAQPDVFQSTKSCKSKLSLPLTVVGGVVATSVALLESSRFFFLESASLPMANLLQMAPSMETNTIIFTMGAAIMIAGRVLGYSVQRQTQLDIVTKAFTEAQKLQTIFQGYVQLAKEQDPFWSEMLEKCSNVEKKQKLIDQRVTTLQWILNGQKAVKTIDQIEKLAKAEAAKCNASLKNMTEYADGAKAALELAKTLGELALKGIEADEATLLLAKIGDCKALLTDTQKLMSEIHGHSKTEEEPVHEVMKLVLARQPKSDFVVTAYSKANNIMSDLINRTNIQLEIHKDPVELEQFSEMENTFKQLHSLLSKKLELLKTSPDSTILAQFDKILSQKREEAHSLTELSAQLKQIVAELSAILVPDSDSDDEELPPLEEAAQ